MADRIMKHISIALLLALCAGLAIGCGSGPGDDVAVWGGRGGIPGRFGGPRAIGVNDGFVYVIDRSGRVQKFTEQGEFVLQWPLEEPERGTPTGIGFDHDGNLWIPDTHQSRILQFSAAGELLSEWGVYGEGEGQFIYPTDIAFGEDGLAYITEYGRRARVQAFTREGDYIRGWGEFGDGPRQMNRPMAIAAAPGERLVVADSVNHRIKVFNYEGDELMQFGREGRGAGEFKFPYDLALDENNILYICEWGNHRIQAFSLDGERLGEWGRLGTEPGALSEPWGVAWSNSTLFIADTKNHRIQTLSDSAVITE